MNKQIHKIDNQFSSQEKALIILRGVAIIRLISIIITFIFWFSLIVSILLLNLFGLIPFDYFYQFLKINQVLGIIGITPFLLTILSWRLIEKICSFFIRKYTMKHIIKK